MMINESLINHRVLCIGEILWDMLPSGAKAGGAPMNVALHLKKHGLSSQFAGRVGNDRLGHSLKDFLINQGLDISLIQVDTNFPTSTVEVKIDSDHQAKYDIVDNVAWDRLELTDELKHAVEEADVLIYGTLASRHALTRETIISIIEKPGLKFIDVNLRPPYVNKEVVELLISKADIAKLNNEELKHIGDWYNKNFNESDLTKWFAEKYNCQTVCITRGAQGVLVLEQGSIFEHSGYRVNVVDTVGSGDAFLAGFLSVFLSGEPIEKALDFACATGALVASKQGGTPDYTIDEIIKIMDIKKSKVD